jgi:nucleotide-binding universal stress UspA family protein
VSSVVQKVILRAHVPVMIVRAYVCPTTAIAGIQYRRLLVPLDGSQRAEYVLSLAATLAHTSGAQLVLAHVVGTPEVPRRMPLTEEETGLVERLTELNRARGVEYLEQLRARFPPATDVRLVVSDDPAAALHDLVDQGEMDLVALSAHGYSGGIKWPYGSTALHFIAYGTTPLLIVQDLCPQELDQTRAEIAAKEAKGY